MARFGATLRLAFIAVPCERAGPTGNVSVTAYVSAKVIAYTQSNLASIPQQIQVPVKPTLKEPAVDPEIAVLLSSRSIDYHEQITGDIPI
jgi:hypothetical protein